MVMDRLIGFNLPTSDRPTGREIWTWLKQRPATIGLVIFFLLWYGLEMTTVHHFGRDAAVWMFLSEHPPELKPGYFLSPLSHDIDALTHILGNTVLLFIAGGLAEPHIGKERVVLTVIGLGYLSTLLAHLVSPIFQLWIVAGASGGILALWAYSGLRTIHLVRDFRYSEYQSWREGVESVGAVFLFLSPPVMFLHQTVWISNVHTGHAFGILVGWLYFVYERYRQPDIEVQARA